MFSFILSFAGKPFILKELPGSLVVPYRSFPQTPGPSPIWRLLSATHHLRAIQRTVPADEDNDYILKTFKETGL